MWLCEFSRCYWLHHTVSPVYSCRSSEFQFQRTVTHWRRAHARSCRATNVQSLRSWMQEVRRIIVHIPPAQSRENSEHRADTRDELMTSPLQDNDNEDMQFAAAVATLQIAHAQMMCVSPVWSRHWKGGRGTEELHDHFKFIVTSPYADLYRRVMQEIWELHGG